MKNTSYFLAAVQNTVLQHQEYILYVLWILTLSDFVFCIFGQNVWTFSFVSEVMQYLTDWI